MTSFELPSEVAELRPFRIYDGPTETHLWAIARRALRERAAATGRPNDETA